MKKIIFNKLFSDVTKFFLLISLSLALIIWVVQAVNFLDYISEDGHGIKTYFLITALNLPKIFSRIIPFCLFLATFYIINKYETKNELLIYWNIGINKIKFINNLIYFSFFFLIIQILLNAFIVPNSQNLARDYIRSSNIDFFPNLIKEKKFIDTVSNLTIYVEKKDNDGNFENVYLKDKLDDDKSQIIYAKSGRFNNKNNKNYLVLENGKFIDVDQKKITTFEFKKTEFDLSKYTTKTTTFPKVQELKTIYLLDCIKNLNNNKEYYKATKILVCSKDLEISIKEDNYDNVINKKVLTHLLNEAKNHCKKSLTENEIIHILITNYKVDGKDFLKFPENLECKNFSIDIQFICFPNLKIKELEKILKKYQITVNQIICANYVKDYFRDNNQDIFFLSDRIIRGCNENEVKIVNKTVENKGFFERFFNFFS